MSVGNLGPYEALGNAVVLQAVKDYREAVHKLARGKKNLCRQGICPTIIAI